MRYFLPLLILFLAAPAFAIMHPSEKLADPTQEARAMALTKELRCVVCQNESIEDSSADIARDLRLLVRREIQAGKSDNQIFASLRARYGDYIMLNPPLDSRTLILWFAPLLLLAAGGTAVYFSMRRRR